MRSGNNKSRSMSILFRILVVFLLVVVPVYFSGTAVYLWGYAKIHSQVVSSSISQLTLYSKTIESEIKRIKDLQYECINDEDILYLVNAFSILDNYERMQYLLRAQGRIRIMQKSSNYIESITLYLVPIGKMITPDRIDSLSGAWQKVVDGIHSASYPGITYSENNTLYMNIQYPVIPREKRIPRLVMEIRLSTGKMQDLLRGFGLSDDSELFIINTAHNFVLSDKHIGFIPHEFLDAITDNRSGSVSVDYKNGKTEITYVYSEELGIHLISSEPTDNVFAFSRQYGGIFIVYTFLSIILAVIFACSIQKIVHQPMQKLTRAFQQLETGCFDIKIAHRRNDEFRYLYQSFNDTMERLKTLIEQVYTQKINAQRAELKQLQSQINPHFLYNSFYNIYQMAKMHDCESISAFSNYLSRYYQYITRNASEEVPMMREIEHAQTYLNIQSMRYAGKIDSEVEPAPSSFENYFVPRLIVQPLIENAFEHGIKGVANPKISLIPFEDDVHFGVIVSDNGNGMDHKTLDSLIYRLDNVEPNTETSALINTHRRLRMRFGNGSGLALSINEEGGITVKLMIEKEAVSEHVPVADR